MERLCTGHWIQPEYVNGEAELVHDTFSFCPVHDVRTMAVVVREVEPVDLHIEIPPLSLDEYQDLCAVTANYPEAGSSGRDAITYTVLGLTGEAGEVADRWKKVMRGDHGDVLDDKTKAMLAAELGDVAWYLARCAKELGFSLSDIARGNIAKLDSRKKRGVISGSGDER